MTRKQLEHAIRASGAICGDRDLYVVGSQAILGARPDAHPDRGLCLDPTDLAVSKLAAAREKDVAFVRVLLREGIVAPGTLSTRAEQVDGLDDGKRTALRAVVGRLINAPAR